MRVHSEKKVKKLRELRKVGHSIHEIMNELEMPKTTVWHHIQSVEVLPQYRQALKSKRGGGSERRLRNIQKATEEASELLDGPYKDFLIALAMLYWAEGSKESPSFINSDGRMIALYLHILRSVLLIPNKSIHITIRIFGSMNRRKCLQYWSEITKTPSKNFIVRLNDGGTRSRTQYGLCRVELRKGGQFLKLMHALIRQVYGQMAT